MLGWATLLRRRDLSAAQVDRGLDALERNTRLQARLLDELLELTRLRSAAVLQRRPVDIAAAVRDALVTAVGEAQARNIQTRVALDPRGGCVVGDPAGLRQVVSGAMAMAIAETPAGGDIAVMLTRPTHDSARLTVRGNPGTPSPAKSAGDGPAPSRRRLGIALVLTKHLVELQEGRLSIDQGDRD
jgi:signal transduction histidine kinase